MIRGSRWSGMGSPPSGESGTDGRPVPRITAEGTGKKWTGAKRGTREHKKHDTSVRKWAGWPLDLVNGGEHEIGLVGEVHGADQVKPCLFGFWGSTGKFSFGFFTKKIRMHT